MRRARILLRLLLLSTAFLVLGCDRGAKPEWVNRPAPDFTVTDSERSVHLADYRGKVIVLNFWATWCPPCVDEMPSLMQMQTRMADKVQVVAVSLDEDPDAYHRFLEQYGIRFLTVRDAERRSSLLYGTTRYPETYIIDRQGIVRRKFIGPVEWTHPDIMDYLKKL
jgi:peroxiredoxin